MHDTANTPGEPPGALDIASNADLRAVPSGALALAGTAVGLLLVAWLFIYVFVFLARGPVG